MRSAQQPKNSDPEAAMAHGSAGSGAAGSSGGLAGWVSSKWQGSAPRPSFPVLPTEAACCCHSYLHAVPRTAPPEA